MPPLIELGVAAGAAPAEHKRMFGEGGWRSALWGGIDSANVEQAVAGGAGASAPFRGRGASYGPLFRAVTLTAQSVAWMITEGHLRVTDLGGRRVKTQRAGRILDLIAGSLDGVRPSETVWNDAAADYAVLGNGLLAVSSRGRFGVPTELTLLNGHSAFTTEGSARNVMYSAAPAYSYEQSFEHFDSREIVHARWPLLCQGYGAGSGSRLGMAESPVALLDRDIRLGICADMFVLDYFAGGTGGVKSKIAIGIKQSLTPDQFTAQMQAFEQYKRGSGPLAVLGDPSFTQISESPSDAETDALRKRQAVSTGRIYGIPPPLMSEDGGTSLGSSVDILIRGYWKFGLRYHVAAFLAGARQALLLPGQKFAINEMAANLGDPKYIPAMLNALRGREKIPGLASAEELRAYAGLPPEIEGELASSPLEPGGPGAAAGGA